MLMVNISSCQLCNFMYAAASIELPITPAFNVFFIPLLTVIQINKVVVYSNLTQLAFLKNSGRKYLETYGR